MDLVDRLRRALSTSRARFFTVGVGTDADAELLDYLADAPLEGAADMRLLVRRLAERAARERTEITLSVARRVLEDEPVVPTPAHLPVIEAVFLDAEKMVLDWADVDGRVIEEYR